MKPGYTKTTELLEIGYRLYCFQHVKEMRRVIWRNEHVQRHLLLTEQVLSTIYFRLYLSQTPLQSLGQILQYYSSLLWSLWYITLIWIYVVLIILFYHSRGLST